MDEAAYQRHIAKQPRAGEIITPPKLRKLKQKLIIIEGKVHHG
jgi:hypothetical protein